MATTELREAIATARGDDDDDSETDETGKSTSVLAKLNEVAKRQELESLATTLKAQLPDARMCPQCNYGPMVHRACDDLRAHQDEVIDEVEREDGTQVQVQIDNSCPQCKWLGNSWEEWLPWDGLLPTVLRGDAFRLGGGEAAAKVLSPAEAREQRLLALQKAADASAASALQKKVNAGGGTSKTDVLSASSMQPKTKQELDEEARKIAYKKLQADKLRAKVEKERILKQFQADRR